MNDQLMQLLQSLPPEQRMKLLMGAQGGGGAAGSGLGTSLNDVLGSPMQRGYGGQPLTATQAGLQGMSQAFNRPDANRMAPGAALSAAVSGFGQGRAAQQGALDRNAMLEQLLGGGTGVTPPGAPAPASPTTPPGMAPAAPAGGPGAGGGSWFARLFGFGG